MKDENTTEPTFVPKSGQTDYTNIRYAPVISCVVRYENKILLLKRSYNLRLYAGYWNGVSGFLDDHQCVEDKVREELREEVGLLPENIRSIIRGEIFHNEDPRINKTWIVHPILVEVTTDNISLDWEIQEYKWVTPEEAKTYKFLPSFDQVLTEFFPS